MGGFIGSISENNNMTLSFSNCTNNGKIEAYYYFEIYGECVGGFVGSIYINTNANITISNCTNNGTFSGKKGIGGFIGFIKWRTNIRVEIIDCLNNGNVDGKNGVGGFVGFSSYDSGTSFNSFFAINNANKGNIQATERVACGMFCVGSTSYNLTTTILNSVNKGYVKAETKAYGIAISPTTVRNVVSMGDVTGKSDSFSFWESSSDADLSYCLKNNCKDSTTNATLFLYNTTTECYDIESGECVHDLLNKESLNKRFGRVWTNKLDFLDKMNLTINVSGGLDASFVVESGTPLNQVNELSSFLSNVKSCLADARSAVRLVYDSAHIVSRNMSLVLGNCSSVSIGSPVNKNRILFDGDELEQLTRMFNFSFDDFISVDKVSGNFVNKSTVIENDMAIALCHNVTVESSENNISESFRAEDSTSLNDNENVIKYTNAFVFIDKNTRKVVQFNTKVTEDMWLLLGHQVNTRGFKSSQFFVESGQQLNTNKGLAEYFDETNFYNVTDAKNGTAYSGSTRVYEDMEVVIIDLCGTFSE